MKKKHYMIIGSILLFTILSAFIIVALFFPTKKEVVKVENIAPNTQNITDANHLEERAILEKLALRRKLEENGVGSVQSLTKDNLVYRYFSDDSLLIYDGTNYYIKNLTTGKTEHFTFPNLNNLEKRDKKTLSFEDVKDVKPTRIVNAIKFNLEEYGENVLKLFEYLIKIEKDFINTIQTVSIYEYNDKLLAYIENNGDYVFYLENGKAELTDLTFDEFKLIIQQFKKEVQSENNELQDPYGRTQSFPKGVSE